jgi:hypothetical protein
MNWHDFMTGGFAGQVAEPGSLQWLILGAVAWIVIMGVWALIRR